MSNPSKRKGTAAETAVVAYMKAHGWPFCERHAHHGAKDVGDVNVGPGVVISVKATNRYELAEWLKDLEQMMAHAMGDDGVVVLKPKGVTDPAKFYAIQYFGRWCSGAKEQGL